MNKTIYIQNEKMWKELQLHCKNQKTSVSRVIEDLIYSWMNDHFLSYEDKLNRIRKILDEK